MDCRSLATTACHVVAVDVFRDQATTSTRDIFLSMDSLLTSMPAFIIRIVSQLRDSEGSVARPSMLWLIEERDELERSPVRQTKSLLSDPERHRSGDDTVAGLRARWQIHNAALPQRGMFSQ
jgi:hypothetical protein